MGIGDGKEGRIMLNRNRDRRDFGKWNITYDKTFEIYNQPLKYTLTMGLTHSSDCDWRSQIWGGHIT